MSALLPVRSRAKGCGCLLVSDGRHCTNRARSRIVFRVFAGDIDRRTDACGIHDHLLAIELAERGAAAVHIKAFKRFRKRRAAVRA